MKFIQLSFARLKIKTKSIQYFVLLNLCFMKTGRFYLQVKKISVEETSKGRDVSNLRVGASAGHRS